MLIFNGNLASAIPMTSLGGGWQGFVGDATVLMQANISGFDKLSAYPDGYYPPHCLVIARSPGRLRSNFVINGLSTVSGDMQSARELLASTGVTGSGDITDAELGQLILITAAITGSGTVSSASIQALTSIIASIAGSGTVSSATISGLLDMASSVMGLGGVTANNTFLATLEANLRGYGDLTPEGIRDAVWAAILESGLSSSDLLRLIAAATQGNATGLEDGSPVFKSIDGTVDRITATYSSGTRTVISRDAD